jgi:pimeloyl-ACP methyl ester carboxylesterase
MRRGGCAKADRSTDTIVPALVILPGLDGTGTLHADFTYAVKAAFASVTVISYPADQALDYSEIESLVRPLLPVDTPFILLGESFSGPVAISIAATPPPNLVGLILSTTFSESPRPLAALWASLIAIAPVRSLPAPLLSWALLGRWRTRRLMTSLQSALLKVSKDVLHHRAAGAMHADVSSKLGAIQVPVLCLRAMRDRLLPDQCTRRMAAAIAHCTVIDMEGPHLLLQAVPAECAHAVKDFAARCVSPPPAQPQPGFPVTTGAFIR